MCIQIKMAQVDVNHFLPTNSKWNSLSEYEKKRYSNIMENWEMLKSIGITPNLPEFLRTDKINSEKIHKIKNQQKGQLFEKTTFKPFAVPNTRRKTYLKGRMQDTQYDIKCKDKVNCKSKKKVQPKEVGLKNFAKIILAQTEKHYKLIQLSSLTKDADRIVNGQNEKTNETPRRYPKRNLKRKFYQEEEVSSDDEFLFCDDCNCEYKGSCPEHGPMLWVCDRQIPKNTPERAALTIPSFLSIGLSSIPKAGLGVWTEVPLCKDVVFGPYKGNIIRKKKDAEKSGYAWMIWKGGKANHFIEGYKKDLSNWLRFVNCADKEERQNLVAFQYKKQIFYRTFKDILPFQELLVWYGGEYAADLGIKLSKNIKESAIENSNVDGFECPICRSLFTSVEVLKRHIKTHPYDGGDRKHRCPHCIYSTNNIHNLRNHLSVHSGERKHECPHCHKAFTREDILKRHLRIHTGEKPFSCGMCGRDFTEKKSMQRHERTHTKMRPYRCAVCGRDFNQQSALTRHNRMHTQQRPYKCPHCEYRSRQTCALTRHVILKHTKQYPHKCQQCDSGFIQKTHLITHIRKKHS